MAEIKAGVTLSLKDLLSQGMNRAAGAASGFAGKTLGAIEKVDQAISGTAAKLAALGLTLSVGAAAKGIIELDHRMARMGFGASASAEQISSMKAAIYDAAQAADVKVDPTHILGGIEAILTKTSDLKYAEENIRNIGLAIQATGESGESIGNVFAEFQKFQYTSEQISGLMDDLIAQSNQGAFSLAEFAKIAPDLFARLNEGIGATPENILKANAAMQIINAGVKNSKTTIAAYNSALEDLADPEKRKNLHRIEIEVIDPVTKEVRDFNDVMLEIAEKSKDARYADYIGRMFNASSMQAIRSYVSHGERMYENLTDLGDTTGLLQQQSARMADTLQSNIKNLQTAFNSFADSNLSEPLANLTGLLNTLAEDPDRLRKIFSGIAVGIGAIAAVKGIAGISRLVGSLLQLKGGSIDLGGVLNSASAMPVYVTNWGGMGGGGSGLPGLPGSGGAGSASVLSKLAPLAAAAAPYVAFAAGTVATSMLIDHIATQKYNIDGKHYSEWEKQAREAALWGDRESELEARIAALRIQIPEYEMRGAGFDPSEQGQFLHWDINGKETYVTLDDLKNELAALQMEAAGLMSGMDGDRMFPSNDLPEQITRPGAGVAPQRIELGQAMIDLNVNLTDSTVGVSLNPRSNTAPFVFNPGSRVELRRSGT